ncbi:preprotein translocase subunit SecG [uncultured Paracoccus sp.]|uniref:preprotein translocase subunit SecG n=1 Tax=uncultured Paracoccus sp. TaxID=189685 RepID=UPI00262D425E|nr:preprotein translocase subunit SecG [uncultured Paracoccus sp.]
MQNVVLTVHLILAVLLIGVVLLQRSEGGGLGLGGGGGGVMTGRQAANALSRATWLLAGAFLVTSIALTVIAARNSADGSVMDRLASPAETTDAPATGLPAVPDYAPPPGVGQPVLPPGAAPATPPAAAAAPAPVAPPADITTPAPAPAPSAAASAPADAEAAPAAGRTTRTVPVGDTPPASDGTGRTVRVPLTAPAETN